MKNVAGYDVSRLQAGALGTLGVITEISLKVLPAPRHSVTLVTALDQAAAIRRMNELAGRPAPLSGAAWLDGRLFLRFSGSFSPSSISGRWGGEIMADAPVFWADLREQRLAFFAGSQPLWRLSLASTAPPLPGDVPTLIEWGGAQRWRRDGDLAALTEAAAKAGGHTTLFRGGDRSGEVRSPPPPPLADLHRRLKAAFDPAGIFNRGGLYGWM